MRPRYHEKIETLETQKADIEMNLATLKIAAGHRYTKEQIAEWLKTFCSGDKLNVDIQKHIIDVLVNSVYVYDDKIIIYYNVKDGKQISYIDACNDIPDSEAEFEGCGGVRISDNTALRQGVEHRRGNRCSC